MKMNNQDFSKLCNIGRTKKEKKKKSVLTSDSMLTLVRSELREFETTRRSKNQPTLIMKIFKVKTLYEKKTADSPEEVDLDSLKEVRPLGPSDIGDDELSIDKRGHYCRKKAICIEDLKTKFNINIVQLRELFKIFDAYKTKSTFLPDVYSAGLRLDMLEINLQHFE